MAKTDKGSPEKTAEKKSSTKKDGLAKKDIQQAKTQDELPRGPKVPARLKEAYRQQVVPALMKEFGYKNPMQVPKVDRVVLNVGMGEAIQNVKLLESATAELGVISGQHRSSRRPRRQLQDSSFARVCRLDPK